MRRAANVEQRAGELGVILAQVVGCDLTRMPDGLDTPLRSLGFDSLLFIVFLVRVEKEYEFQWSEDTPPEALSTIKAMAELMLATTEMA
jgi:acyl carrier protein